MKSNRLGFTPGKVTALFTITFLLTLSALVFLHLNVDRLLQVVHAEFSPNISSLKWGLSGILSLQLGLLAVLSFTQVPLLQKIKRLAQQGQKLLQGEIQSHNVLEIKGNDESVTIGKIIHSLVSELSHLVERLNKNINGNVRKAEKNSRHEKQNFIYTTAIRDNLYLLKKISSIQSRMIDEIKNMSIKMLEDQSSTAKDVKSVNQSMDDLQSRLNQEVAAVNEIAATLEEVSSNTHSIAGISQNAVLSSEELKRIAENGDEKVQGTLTALTELTSSLNSVNDFVAVIIDIANKTNLLAMNAAIEAAHAGEAGKGFAVVADEIRKLADSSNKQAELAGESLRGINDRIGSTQTISNELAELFINIGEHANKVFTVISQVRSAMDEQNEATTEMVKAISEISESSEMVQSRYAGITDIMKRIEELSKNNAMLADTNLSQVDNIQKMTHLVNHNMNDIESESIELQKLSSDMLVNMADFVSDIKLTTLISENNFFQTTAEEKLAINDSAKELRINADFFEKSRLAHLNWKGRIRDHLENIKRIDLIEVLDHHQCELGQWMQSVTYQEVKILKLIDFDALENVHRELHQGIKTLVEHEGELTQDLLRIYQQYLSQSETIIALLDQLEVKAKAKNLVDDSSDLLYIRWNDNFSVGSEDMDNEHKKLVEVINTLYTNLLKQSDNLRIVEILGELKKYTEYHFTHEEEIMEAVNYPKLKGHKGSHQSFCDKVDVYIKAFESNEAIDKINLLQFLKNWLIGHILKEDMQYKPYFEKA